MPKATLSLIELAVRPKRKAVPKAKNQPQKTTACLSMELQSIDRIRAIQSLCCLLKAQFGQDGYPATRIRDRRSTIGLVRRPQGPSPSFQHGDMRKSLWHISVSRVVRVGKRTTQYRERALLGRRARSRCSFCFSVPR